MSDSPVEMVNNAGDDGRAAAALPATPGAVLSAARKAQALTVEQVASHLNLAPRQVVALEADDFAALPGMVIARGFLRGYAKFLRLDPVALLSLLGEQNQPASSAPMRHALSGSFSESRLPSQGAPGTRGKSLPVVAGIAVLVAAAAGSYALGWWPEVLSRRIAQLRLGALSIGGNAGGDAAGNAGDNAAASSGATPPAAGGAETAPALSAPAAGRAMLTTTTTLAGTALAALGDGNVQPGPANAPSGTTATGTTATGTTATGGAGPVPALTPSSGLKSPLQAAAVVSTATARNPLVLNIQEDSWVELKRADNTPLVAKIIKAGSIETFDVSEPLTLTIGNIAGVEASLRGAPIALASAATGGNVARVQLK